MKNSNSLMNFLPLPAAAGSHRVRPTAPRRNLFTRLCRIGLAAGLLLTGITAGRADSTLPSGLCADGKKTTEGVDWRQFLSRHDLQWDTLTADPVKRSMDNHLRTGYYDGAIMGNGLIGTNLYKLEKNIYRLNVGRSDVTEARSPYSLFNSARLPIGYFTLRTCGEVNGEQMRLSIYDAITRGTFTTTRGALHFQTYVHACRDLIVFETEAEGGETDFAWDFVPQQAISPRYCMNGTAPEGYLNHRKESNPRPVRKEADGLQLLVQPLATDTTFRHIARVYAVAWKEVRQGNRRRIVATVAQEKDEGTAVQAARRLIDEALEQPAAALEKSHREWWNAFYRKAAYLTFPDPAIEKFYWMQYYKFASTARPGKPVVDLQGVWPTWDTPWTAIWLNLNVQLTYSWQVKANLGELAQPLWDALWNHRDNLRRNVTDIAGQEDWTDAACLPRTATYDLHAPLDPKQTVESNQYEAGNLTWTLFYYWQHCQAYGDTLQLTRRLFPLLKSAVNLFFHIRTTENGRYGLPPTASPEYISKNIGPNTNYDLANLRWGLQTLIDIDRTCGLNDPMLPRWKDFLDRLVDFPYDEKTGYKVSDRYAFTSTSHRHYSHLFMIYPYHLLDWNHPIDGPRMRLSVDRWQGNQGYSRTGKAAMLASRGDGDGALAQLRVFFSRYLKPNTLYAETGPCIETPMAAVASLHELYLQDWGDRIRVFYGLPTTWTDASFVNMRAKGAFLVSALRRNGRTEWIQVESEKGGRCRLQTGIPASRLRVRDGQGRLKQVAVVDAASGTVEMPTRAAEVVLLEDTAAR